VAWKFPICLAQEVYSDSYIYELQLIPEYFTESFREQSHQSGLERRTVIIEVL
jgi:hypothetical protein